MKKYLIIVLFSLLSCSSDNKYEYKERLFKKYLFENFSEKKSNNDAVYVFIPKMACSGCVNAFISDFQTFKDTINCSLITVITSDTNTYNRLKKYSNILYDYKGNIDRINLELSSVTLFYTKNMKIINIENIY